MKITYLVSQFPKLSETFVLGQITGLIDRGHEVEIIALSNPCEKTVHDDIIKYNLLEKVHYVEYHSNELGIKFDEELINSLVYTDIIHAHFAAYPATWALRISEKFGVPFIFTAHAYDIYIDPDIDILRKKFNSAKKVITISDYNKKYLLNLVGQGFEEKLQVIRCGIDLNDFKYTERADSNNITILFVGRLIEKKGTGFAIEAFSKIANQYDNVELRIIGDGPLLDELVDLINRFNLKERVHLIGSQSKSSVIEEMEKADIFFLPSVTAENSDREGIPVSIIEAQATGLPVVSTLHSGIPEVVSEGESGFLVQEKDTDAMAEKLRDLIQDRNLRVRMGKAGYAHVNEHHNREMELEKLNNLIEKVFKDRVQASYMPQVEIGTLQSRIQSIAKLLHNIDNELQEDRAKIKKFGDEVKQKDKELKKKTSEIEKRDNEIKQNIEEIHKKTEQIHNLQERLDNIQNTTAYKIYTRFLRITDKIKDLIGTTQLK